MKIAITGVTGFRNRGVEALVRPTVRELLRRHPDAQITIATWSPEYDAARLEHPQVAYVEDAYLSSGQWSCEATRNREVGARSLWSRALRKASKLVSASAHRTGPAPETLAMPFDAPDLLIVSGGDLYSSDYGTDSLRHFLSPVKWARQRDIPCALIGQSVGRFKCEADIQLWKEAEAAASLITLREPLSRDYLTGELGSPSGRFEVTADTAFLLEEDAAAAAQLAPLANAPIVALSISESICKWTGNDYQKHIDVWVELIRLMLDRWGVHVVIIPHVQERFSDDRLLSTRILRLLGFDQRVRIFADDLGAAEFKAIVARCQLVVAERMHAAIAGLSSGVCTVPIGYSIKAKGIVTSVLEGSSLSSDDLVLPLGELLDFAYSSKKLTAIWENRDEYRRAVGSTVARSKAQAERNFDLIDALLQPK